MVSGIPALSKIHHAAFDAHVIGVDPDYRIHVSSRLLELHDGPFLELGLKQIGGQLIKLPRRCADYPDRDRLALGSSSSRGRGERRIKDRPGRVGPLARSDKIPKTETGWRKKGL